MAKFKVGDRVKLISENTIGVVSDISRVLGCYRYFVEFNDAYHLWVLEELLTPAPYSVNIPKPTWRIIIEGDEDTSRAKYIMGKKVIKEATAKRHPLDDHDPSVAARVLIDKMFPHTAEKAEPPKFFNGRIVCIEKPYQRAAVTVGKIYEVTNGQFVSNDGYKIPANPIVSVDELNNRYGNLFKFIEIKED